MSTPSVSAPHPHRVLYGLDVDALRLPEVVDIAARTIDEHGRLLVGVVNAAKIAKLRVDPVLRDSLLTADVLLADGQSVVWASRLLRRPLPERVAGIDLFEALLGLADERHLRVYLLGATPEVLERLRAAVADRWPGLVLAGWADGYYRAEESDEVAERIAASHADLLFLGMTTPRKENFVAAYGSSLGVPVVHGVGGSFDVLAGVTQRAPEAWQRAGLEWAYRVRQEPRRLWRRYLVTNTVFVGLTAAELLHRRGAYPRPGAPEPAPTHHPDPHTDQHSDHLPGHRPDDRREKHHG
ncbi:WecB/TagA/CpsF family glycosyltransferase [Nocardioides dongxiaopingii]|uniref:WecB/TagA/CpsF family glycosyltransferase n=1 Tax=Nocardioides sp. S-1144 TaxID=2582905 RepID=UPI00110D444F|nr:WecB/TagA/CpsF family glycosyltransferase [Nocardioides sp. S-1144]QCW50789.1 WecB/TagA/CpsF family glycosyltransferase [Nocardioides sp. S-1144]